MRALPVGLFLFLYTWWCNLRGSRLCGQLFRQFRVARRKGALGRIIILFSVIFVFFFHCLSAVWWIKSNFLGKRVFLSCRLQIWLAVLFGEFPQIIKVPRRFSLILSCQLARVCTALLDSKLAAYAIFGVLKRVVGFVIFTLIWNYFFILVTLIVFSGGASVLLTATIKLAQDVGAFAFLLAGTVITKRDIALAAVCLLRAATLTLMTADFHGAANLNLLVFFLFVCKT